MSGTLFSAEADAVQDREWDERFLPDFAAALKQARWAIQAAWDCCPYCGQGMADAFATLASARPAGGGGNVSDRVIYWLKDCTEVGYGSLDELRDHWDYDMEPTAPNVYQIEKAVYVPDVWAAVSLDPDDPDCSLVTEHVTKEEAEAELAERITKLEAEGAAKPGEGETDG